MNSQKVNKQAQKDLLLSLVISVGGVIIAASKPTDWWGTLVLLAGIMVTVAGTLKSNRGEIPTFFGKSKGEDNGNVEDR